MSYHGLGAGPGPVETYYVDMPFPWGEDTEVRVPVAVLVRDAVRAISPSDVSNAIPWDSLNRRLQASLPVWIEQANKLAEPHIDRYINKAILKFALVSAALMGGAFLVARKMK